MTTLTKEKEEERRKIIGNDIYRMLHIIYDKKHWCQRAMCRNVEGEQLFNPFDKTAVQFCVLGIFYALNGQDETLSFLNNNSILNGYSGVERMNDMNTHENVMNFLIACLKIMGYDNKKFKVLK